MVKIKTAAEIDAMRPACRLAADTLVMIEPFIRPGISTDEINDLVHDFTVRAGAIRPVELSRLSEIGLHLDQPCRLPRHSRRQKDQGG